MSEEIFKVSAEQLRQPHGDLAIQVGEKMNEINVHIHRYTFEALNISANDSILEIGMGNGNFVKDLFKIHPDINYVGCDFSEKMVEESTKNNAQLIAAGKVAFHFANAAKLPLHDAAVNKIFTINTLYFWENPAEVLSELHRILQPKGQLTITIRPKEIMQHYAFVKYGFTLYAKEDLVDLLNNNHFSVINIVEKNEPNMEVNGEKMPTATLLVTAEKM
ncbi:MAG TPA: class I SAM-dependent methyltransferase [Chitinophagales bacterium]|nr:class I SAM-dependent methyltransferase [Chitinophagales bacterium]